MVVVFGRKKIRHFKQCCKVVLKSVHKNHKTLPIFLSHDMDNTLRYRTMVNVVSINMGREHVFGKRQCQSFTTLLDYNVHN